MKPDTAAACQAAISAVTIARDLLNAEGREAIAADNHVELIRTYAELREQAEALREVVADFAKMEQALSYDVIPSSMKRAGVENARVTGYGLVSLVRDWKCSILKGKKEEGHQYLRDIGQGGMIVETVPAQTLGAWWHRYSDETGKELPRDIFSTGVVTHLSLRASR